MATERDPSHPDAAVSPGPELRLLDRRAFVGFPPLAVAPGLIISDFALQIPEVSFPFSFSGGASRYQKKKLAFGFLEVTIDAELVARKVAGVAGRLNELDGLKLHFRPGYIEGQARLVHGDRAPVTFKIAFDGDGERLALYVYDIRLYGFSTVPAAQVPVLLADAVRELELLPEVELRGATGLSARVLPALVELAAVGRGYKMPALDQARLSAAEVTSQGLKLRFTSGGLPPPTAPDEELLLSLEGARAFADAEALLAQGKLAEARKAYLKHGDVTDAHPFAIERLLTLLVADPQAHELALDVAATLARRREKCATAIWAEAVVRERRGESARAAERYLALCAHARRAQEEASAFFAAESAARAARDQAPQMAVKALHEVLGLKPDHLPSLKALARAADQANDRAGAIRAWRRIAALARDPAEAADAHVHMARLCALTEDDVAGARLHCEAALRLSPNHPEALYQLAELCHRAGEHLRAIKALERLREVALARHEVDRIGRANVLAGRVWEEGLQQPENALLRYREAIALLPGEPEPLYLSARVAEALGKVQEAVSGYQQAIELAGPSPRDEQTRIVAHASHHAMARLLRTKLGEPARAREHLEAALALDPKDLPAIEELLPYFRASGKSAELADALEKAAAVIDDPIRRAALWAEAGELYRGRLAKPERAEQLLAAALEADPENRVALEGMLALAEAHRDGGQLCRCLDALARLEQDPQLRVRHLRRLAVAARDLAFDLDLAARALRDVLAVEPNDLPALGELCALQRRRADMNGLAAALEQRARVAEAQGDRRLASAALRELSQVLEARLGRVAEALVALEKAARLSPDPALLFDLADLSLRCDRPQNARRALEDLLASLPQSTAPERMAEIRARLGRACEDLGDPAAAIEHYAQAFPLRRLDDELAARLEALYREAGETQKLAELWAARAQAYVAADRPEDAAPLFLESGRALLRLGERGAAIIRLNAALDASPEGPLAGEILESIAELELERGARREAARLFARRAALLQDERAAARLYWRAAQLSFGHAREDEYLAQALAREPRFAPARIRRAELRADTEPRAALDDLEAVLALPADDADAPDEAIRLELHRKAAAVATRAERFDTARRLLSVYAAQRPEDLDAQRELVALHRRAGARDAVADLLAELWHRLSGDEQRTTLREYAELCLELGRSLPALEALRALLEIDPQNLWAAGRLLALLPKDARDEERLSLITLLLGAASGEERAELLGRRAQLHRATGRLDAAADDLRAAIQLTATPSELLRALAEVTREAGDARAELDVWRSARVRDPSFAALAAPRVLAIAQAALEQQNTALARDAFETALGLTLSEEDRCVAAFGLADAALAQGDRAAAIDALAEAAKQGPSPKRLDAHLRRAALLEATGALEEAAKSWEAALALSPHHPEATSGLKRIWRTLERWDALAQVMADEAVQLTGPEAAAHLGELGTLWLERLDNPEAAESAFRRAAQLDETNVDARRKVVQLLADRGDWAEAAGFATELSTLLPAEEAAAILQDLGQRAHEHGASEVALRLLRRAHELSPDTDGAPLRLLADLLYLKGGVREALPLVQRLAERADFTATPDDAEALLLRLAELAEQVEDVALAEQSLRRVLAARPGSGAAAERLSLLLARRDPRASVQVLWDWARQLDDAGQALPLLKSLAARARDELADVELTAAVLRRIAELSPTPLEAHRALVALHRETGRTPELMAELLQVATLSLEAGDLDGALTAYEEEADLAEASGRLDEALRTLTALRELCENEGQAERAARYELRRAELLRDGKLDLEAAEQALQKSFELSPSLLVARQGEELARRRDDAAAQADWIERGIDLHESPADKAQAFLALARLFDGPLAAPSQAEAAARQALRIDPSLEEAESLLLRAFEREGRLAELAQYHEERAAQTEDPETRARLYLQAAEIYRDRAGRPDDAVAALIAARGARPDDLELTAECAELLHQMGRASDAAEYDAVLLEVDPFRPVVFERHAAHLAATQQWPELAALMLLRAERQRGAEAASDYLAAADAFRKAGAQEQALLCEDRAFDEAPENDRAFEAVRARATDVRRRAEIYRQRAGALEGGAKVRLLRERADELLAAGETLLAAEAFDELLAVASEDVDALMTRAELAAAAGGAQAAQPYDRRLLAAAGDTLPVPVRAKVQLRLGHASLGSGALTDAADAFEAVLALDPDGERGAEALSLLAEVHARTQNREGLFRTSLLLAQKAEGEEAEALLRRAAELFDHPADALDALLPLARLRPSDTRVVERAAEGLRALGRAGELVDLYEKGAEAVGGPQAAEWLLHAADVLANEMADPQRADVLRERAGRADPANAAALRALADGLRRRGDTTELAATLDRLIAALDDGDEQALARLERAQLAVEAGDDALAQMLLEEIVSRGPAGAGYAQALEALCVLLERFGDDLTLGTMLARRAALTSGEDRARLSLEAARAYERAGDVQSALKACRDALASHPSAEAMELSAALYARSGEWDRAARAYLDAAALAPQAAQGTLRLRAAEMFQAGGEKAEARELLQQLADEHPDVLPPDELARRFEVLGDAARAVAYGFPTAMREGRYEEALRLADLAQDGARAEEALWALAGEKGPQMPADLIERVVGAARARAKAAGEVSSLERAAELFPKRRAGLLRELFELHREAGDGEAAARALEALLQLEADLPARSALHVELGELYLRVLDRPAEAREAFELALTEDLQSVAAVRHLVALLSTTDEHERLVAMAERLVGLVGPAGAAPYREPLAQAYLRLQRPAEAYRLLSELPPTEERLRLRAELAETLGLTGEALQLREQITTDPGALEAIWTGYARAALVPFAVRLGERLLEEGTASAAARREVAERLSPAPDGAAFAVRLWPDLLRAAPADADGWTLFGEALAKCGREEAARLADGFGAALTGSTQAAPGARMGPVRRPAHKGARGELTGRLFDITHESMPRLFATLSGALEALGAPGLWLKLDADGGLEAWLHDESTLVLGAGALGAFGPVELGWLCALALALGEEGRALTVPGGGQVPTDAAVAAFDAHPASLAACRVLALLDERVRGMDPALVDMGEVLRGSEAFAAIAIRALELV